MIGSILYPARIAGDACIQWTVIFRIFPQLYAFSRCLLSSFQRIPHSPSTSASPPSTNYALALFSHFSFLCCIPSSPSLALSTTRESHPSPHASVTQCHSSSSRIMRLVSWPRHARFDELTDEALYVDWPPMIQDRASWPCAGADARPQVYACRRRCRCLAALRRRSCSMLLSSIQCSAPIPPSSDPSPAISCPQLTVNDHLVVVPYLAANGRAPIHWRREPSASVRSSRTFHLFSSRRSHATNLHPSNISGSLASNSPGTFTGHRLRASCPPRIVEGAA